MGKIQKTGKWLKEIYFVCICGQLAAAPATAGDEISLCGSTEWEGASMEERSGPCRWVATPFLAYSGYIFLHKHAGWKSEQGSKSSREIIFIQFY